jgi:hypothetical protein
MIATSGFQRSWVHSHSAHNIDMQVEPEEEGGKLAHGRIKSARLPVRAKTRRQAITPDETPGLLRQSSPGRRQTAIFPESLYQQKKLCLRMPQCWDRTFVDAHLPYMACMCGGKLLNFYFKYSFSRHLELPLAFLESFHQRNNFACANLYAASTYFRGLVGQLDSSKMENNIKSKKLHCQQQQYQLGAMP